MKKLCIFLLLLFAATGILFAQEIEKSVKERLSNYFETYTPASANTGSCKLKSVDIDFEGRKLSIYASESFAYQPFVPETVDEIYHQIEELLPGPVRFFRTTIYANNQPIEELIPNFFRGKKKKDKSRLSNAEYKGAPWVINTSRPYEITKGLQNRHISLWQSMANITRTIKANGDGNVHVCSALPRTCSRNLSFCLMSSLCSKTPELMSIPPGSGILKRMR